MKTIEENINSKEFKKLMAYIRGREDHLKYMILKGNKIDILLPLRELRYIWQFIAVTTFGDLLCTNKHIKPYKMCYKEGFIFYILLFLKVELIKNREIFSKKSVTKGVTSIWIHIVNKGVGHNLSLLL